MAVRIRTNEHGDILIPHDKVGGLKPNTEYEVEQQGNALRVTPVDEPAEVDIERLQARARWLWTEASVEERLKALDDWYNEPKPPGPVLSDEALRRENIYD